MAVDTVKADKAIEAFESDLKKSNNYDKVFEDYKSLMDLSVEISDIMTLNWAETEKLNNGMNVTSTREFLKVNMLMNLKSIGAMTKPKKSKI